MADATGTKAAAGVQARTLHEGVNAVTSTYTADHSHSAGDVIQMVKVPTGARILDVVLAPNPGVGSLPAAIMVAVGDGGDENRFITSFSFSVAAGVTRLNTAVGHGHLYSLSDDAWPRYDTVDVTIGGSGAALSISHSFALTVLYHMDD